jgi:hypothetical protein
MVYGVTLQREVDNKRKKELRARVLRELVEVAGRGKTDHLA